MNNDKNLSGSIVLVKGTSWISKQIIMHNRFIAWIEKHKPLAYSHAEFLLWKNGVLWTIGAREKGVEMSRATDYYQGVEYLILKPVVPLTSMEEYSLSNFYDFMDKSRYQFVNLMSWINYIHTFGKVWLSTKGTNRVYCYELAARFSAYVYRWSGSSLDRVSIYDLYNNTNYKEL
jgi:hypothetical protein